MLRFVFMFWCLQWRCTKHILEDIDFRPGVSVLPRPKAITVPKAVITNQRLQVTIDSVVTTNFAYNVNLYKVTRNPPLQVTTSQWMRQEWQKLELPCNEATPFASNEKYEAKAPFAIHTLEKGHPCYDLCNCDDNWIWRVTNPNTHWQCCH